MTDKNKTRKQLIDELASSRRQIKELEKSSSKSKQTEKVLKESQHLINSVFESIQEGISVLAPDLTIRHVNNLMKEWYAENLPLEGKKCYEVYQNRKRPCDPCPSSRCMKSGKTERDIVPGLPGSAVEWIELFSYPMKDPETGKINGAVEFVRDITARKKAEEALQKSEGKYRLLTESSQDGIYIIGTEGFEYVNSAFKKMLGYKTKEIFSKDFNFLDTIHPKDKKLIEERKEARKKGKKLSSLYSFRIITKSGKTKHVEVNTVPLPGEGTHILGILRDITKKKQAEILLEAERNLGLNLSRTSSLKETLNFCLETAIYVSEMDSGGIYLIDEKSGEIDLVVHEGLPSVFLKSASHYSADSANARLINKGKPIYSRHQKIDVDTDNARIKEGLRAIAILPVFHKKKVVACLNVASHELNEVPKLSRTALEGIASVIGGAIIQAKMEEQVQVSEQKFKDLANLLPQPIWETDLEGNFTYTNSSGYEALGYTSQDLEKGVSIKDVFAPEDRKRIISNFQKVLQGKEFDDHEYTCLKNDGTKFPALTYSAPILQDGKPSGVRGIILDTTELKQAAEALRKSEEQLRLIAESTTDNIAITTFDLKATYIYVNPSVKSVLGYDPEDLIGKSFFDFIHPDDKKVLFPLLKKYIILKTKKLITGKEIPISERIEFRFKNKIGNWRYMQSTVNIVRKELLAVTRDITDSKLAEEKIKAQLQEKEVLLKEIHHRVKNNMQIIVSLLRLQSYAAKDKKIEDMFNVAQNRIHSMAVIHEKLYKSKDLASIDFSPYIRSLTTHLMQTYQIDPKQITLKTDVKDVHLDINQGVPVGLLLNELVSNALKHAFPKGKKGEISLKFSVDKKGKKTLIVSDNGIGFPEKVNIRKPETLGIQLIKDLTRQIGGKLDLDTKAGTKFTITFT